MGYFSKQVGRRMSASSGALVSPASTTEGASQAHFAAQVGKPLIGVSGAGQSGTGQSVAALDRCPRCMGTLAEEDGFMRCGGRCGGRWVVGGVGRWLDPATLPFGVCNCCRPRVPLVRADMGAICPTRHAEYLILPEGVVLRADAAPLGICRCCLPPQPLVKVTSGLVCRNKPQQHYQVVDGATAWLGSAPAADQAADQAAVTAAIDAALSANSAALTLFGLFAPPAGGR